MRRCVLLLPIVVDLDQSLLTFVQFRCNVFAEVVWLSGLDLGQEADEGFANLDRRVIEQLDQSHYRFNFGVTFLDGVTVSLEQHEDLWLFKVIKSDFKNLVQHFHL